MLTRRTTMRKTAGEIVEPSARARKKTSLWVRFNEGFNRQFNRVLDTYERSVRLALKWPAFSL